MKPAVVLAAATLGIAFGATASQASTPSVILFAANRAPSLTGEIYRLDPNGHRVDLSKSPYQDSSPVVSPDGKHVAFVSDRGGRAGIYEVGVDGRGLVALARRVPFLDTNNSSLSWQPHGDLLATGSNDDVSIVRRGRLPINFLKARFGGDRPWSPDGRVLLLFQGLNELRAVSPAGRTLWTQGADSWSGVWSSKGLVAVAAYRGIAVYDEAGHLRFKVSLPTSAAAISWSPDGSRLAFTWGVSTYKLEVRTASGRLLLARHVGGGGMAWAGNSTVVLGEAGCDSCEKTVGIDVRTGKQAPASNRWLEPQSPDGKLAIVTPQRGAGFALGVARLGTGRAQTYGKIGGCYGDGTWVPAVSSQQFAGRSIVYENWGGCDPPVDNLYAAGASVHRLTNVPAQETQPALSPDGAQIAYVWAAGRGMNCKGCSDGIRVASSSGAPVRTLTNPQDCTFDDSPTWSPDGTTILYSESTCDGGGELFTIPVGGGTPHDLGIAGAEPAWGPTRIAYVGNNGLTTARPDGSDPVLVAKRGAMPAWSSTGDLAYLLGTTLVVGSSRAKLPFTGVRSLAWTRDGTRLVVAATTRTNGVVDLWTIKPNGTDPVRVTRNYGVSS